MNNSADQLVKLRRHLHTLAEVSHEETKTAEFVLQQLEQWGVAEIITGLGGQGIAAVFPGQKPGPTVLLRCELDALPIPESMNLAHRSLAPETSHRCGHDGHMAILLGVARELASAPPRKGRAVLLFQPAEETGEGAARVIADPGFAPLKPDFSFALHNLPGFAEGQVIVRSGQFAATSRGLIVHLQGRTSHAAEPESGNSPTMAVANLLSGLSTLPQFKTSLNQASKVTIIHANIGEVAFGTSPGKATVMATLRAFDDKTMASLSKSAEDLARNLAGTYDLGCQIDWCEEFPATINDAEATNYIQNATRTLGISSHEPSEPFAWTEDFGHFTALSKGALFGLGGGVGHPVLHSPEYDFPDKIIEIGRDIFGEILNQLLRV